MISPISGAELACFQERGNIELPVHWRLWLREAIEQNRWNILPTILEIVEEAWPLPGVFHADPADRILTASARREDLILLTTDRKILEYPHVSGKS